MMIKTAAEYAKMSRKIQVTCVALFFLVMMVAAVKGHAHLDLIEPSLAKDNIYNEWQKIDREERDPYDFYHQEIEREDGSTDTIELG